VYLKTGLIREMASLEGDNLVVFYYRSVSENWPDKRGGLAGRGQSSGILLSQCIRKLSWSEEATPLIRPVFRYTKIVKYH
jgi:hypothetical protein